MTEAIADGVFVFATDTGHYLHDTTDHGLGVIGLESETAAVLQSICQLAELEVARYPKVRTSPIPS